MPYKDFTHVNHWVFDLDNTLYPPDARLFDQIERLMAEYVMRELGVDSDAAHKLRHDYWTNHGTTLAGLIHHHQIDPEPYLREVHEIDLSALSPDADLRSAIIALPGRKIVYTNGSRNHAARVTEARGLDGIFDAMYGVEDAGYVSKPHPTAFEAVFGKDGTETTRAAMFEDDPRNLEIPHALGMKTVLVGRGTSAAHISHQTNDLTGFLSQIVRLADSDSQD